MTEIRFVTREIGSLAKPGWRVKAIAGRPVEEKDVEEAREWGWRLGIDSDELAEILRKGGSFSNEEKVKIQDFAALYGIRILEHAGLDVVYDGEQRRSEMYDHVVSHAKGFETRGTVRSFDNKYYTKAAVVEKPLVERAYDLEEFEFVRSHTDRAVKTFNATREGVDARASMHICFSDYNSLFPHIEALDDCYELQLEFSNRDSRELGTKAEDRFGYDVLERFAGSAWDGKIGLGVIDIHTNFIEPPELVRDRILYAARVLGPERVEVNTDCGLRTRTWEVSLGKLKNMVEGTRLAEEALNGS